MLSAAANLQGSNLLQQDATSRPGRRRQYLQVPQAQQQQQQQAEDLKKPPTPPPPPEAAPFRDARHETQPDQESAKTSPPVPPRKQVPGGPAPVAPETPVVSAPTFRNAYQTRPDDDEKVPAAPSLTATATMKTTTTTTAGAVALPPAPGATKKPQRAPRYLYPEDDATADDGDTAYGDQEENHMEVMEQRPLLPRMASRQHLRIHTQRRAVMVADQIKHLPRHINWRRLHRQGHQAIIRQIHLTMNQWDSHYRFYLVYHLDEISRHQH